MPSYAPSSVARLRVRLSRSPSAKPVAAEQHVPSESLSRSDQPSAVACARDIHKITRASDLSSHEWCRNALIPWAPVSVVTPSSVTPSVQDYSSRP